MAGSYNKIMLIGNLGRDPETRSTSGGDTAASFSVATTERTSKGDATTWFRVSAFGALAAVCTRYLRTGSYVYIEGTLTQREYTTREGQIRQSLEVRAREMRLLDKADREEERAHGRDASVAPGARTRTGAHVGILGDDGGDTEDTGDAPF